MKIVQVVPGAVSEASGPDCYVLHLCKTLASCGERVELHLLETGLKGKFPFPVYTYPRHFFPHPLMGRSPEMRRGLIESARNADVIHNSSLWMYPNIYPLDAARRSRAKLVVSPHGCLAEWARKRHRLGKWVIGNLLGQYGVLRRADLFHATSHKEYREIRDAGYRRPVAVIPIGVDIPEIGRVRPARRKLLFLGRIHPVKAVGRLLEAWARVAPGFPGWDFQIVGPDCGLLEPLREMAACRRIPRVEFSGEKTGGEKFRCYASADLYVLPSFTENFGITVAEALACGTPVIVSDQTPWQGVVQGKCGWCVDNSVDSLAGQLGISLSMERGALEEMGARGRAWMAESFSWDGVARAMRAAYRWILRGGEKPDFIRVD